MLASGTFASICHVLTSVKTEESETNIMAGEKIQIGFRVDERLKQRIEAACIKRDLSLQDLMRYAVEDYIKAPENWDYKQEIYVLGDPKETREEVAERTSWFDLWLKYTNTMPKEKVEIMVNAMKMDLLNYRSSRRKR